MTLNATYFEQPTPGYETESVTIIDVNPFGPNGEMDRRLLISKDAEPILIYSCIFVQITLAIFIPFLTSILTGYMIRYWSLLTATFF